MRDEGCRNGQMGGWDILMTPSGKLKENIFVVKEHVNEVSSGLCAERCFPIKSC